MRRAAALAALVAAGCATPPPSPPAAGPVARPAAAPAPAAVPPVPAAARTPPPPAPASPPARRDEPIPAPPPDLRILLASSRSPLGSGDLKALEAIANRMEKQPGASVAIESYSTWHGSREFNMALAQRRADEVKAVLVRFGVPPGLVRTTAYGEERRSGTAAEQSRIDIRVAEAGG